MPSSFLCRILDKAHDESGTVSPTPPGSTCASHCDIEKVAFNGMNETCSTVPLPRGE